MAGRGPFVALQCGVSHGSGQRQPQNLTNSDRNAAILEELNDMEFFRRVAGFATTCMASWAPDLHGYYVDHLNKVFQHDPSLKKTSASTCFPVTSYNFGPRTVCCKHLDFANLPFGLCAITSLGNFDPTKGGHIVLWECKLVIEFPLGSTILIPSAIISHSNISIVKNEIRYSVAHYAAGGLFRWVDHNFMKAVDYYVTLSEEGLARAREEDAERWAYGLSLLPILRTEGLSTTVDSA